MQEKDIQKLIKKAQGHNPDAFTELIQLYLKDMYRTAVAILMNDEDAADAIQDTILTCWEKIDTLRESKYFKTWITRILINKCYSIRKQRENKVPFDECEEMTACEVQNEELHEMLSVLEERYRVSMMLYYGQGYKTGEIVQLLHIPKSTVQTRIARGREKLAAYYEGRKE